jgi:AraC-like DNA-binding protein
MRAINGNFDKHPKDVPRPDEQPRFNRSIVRDEPAPDLGIPYLRTFGLHRTASPDYRYFGKDRDPEPHGVIQMTLSGRGRLERRGRRYDFPPGTAMLLFYPDDHVYYLPDKAGHWEFMFALFHLKSWAPVFRRLWRAHGPLASTPAGGPVHAGMLRLYELLRAAAPVAAMDIHLQLLRTLWALDEPARPIEPGTPGAGAVLAATALVSRDFADPNLSVRGLAKAAGVSAVTLNAAFTRATGTTPARYIRRRRLEAAARLLAATDRPVKAIALECGFGSDNYFCKDFRRAVGLSPARFRAAHAGQGDIQLTFAL